MGDWKSYLNGDATEWLLERGNPSVKYLTLTRLLDRPESNLEVIETRLEIMREGAVPRILAKQRNDNWNEPGKYYRDKYKGTVWQLIILAEHMADGNNSQVHAACEYLLTHSVDKESGGFSVDESVRDGGGRHSSVIPCLTGNMVFGLLRLGYLDDPRVARAIDWITTYQRFDDGDGEAPTGWPYDRLEICFGTHVCHMGVVKALKALAEIPMDRRSEAVKRTIRQSCEYLLVHHVYKRSHDLSQISKPGWLRLQFPLMYQTDVLETARILAELGYRDERMQEAIDKIVSKQTDEGRWLLDTTFNGRFQVDIEEKGLPSKWITLNALRLLKSYYG